MGDLALPKQPTYEQILALEDELRKYPPVECPVFHHFAEGTYTREVHIPAGTTLTGKIHRFSTINILAKGEIEVTGPEGMTRMTAPAVFVSGAGMKKVGHAITDVVWINVHPSSETDLAALEQTFIVPEGPAIEHKETPCLGSP